MKMNYTFKHLDHSNALVEHTQSCLEQIGKFLLKEGQGHVYYSKHIRGEFNGEYCVEVSFNTKQKHFKAKAIGTDIYACVHDVVDKLEKQFLKVRKINKHHKKFDLSREGKLSHLNNRFELKNTGKNKAA